MLFLYYAQLLKTGASLCFWPCMCLILMKLTRVMAATPPYACPVWPFRSCCCSSCYFAAANLLLSVHLSRPLLMYVMHGSSSEPEPELQLEPEPEPETGAKRVKC